MSIDRKCMELAEHFLPSFASERIKAGLAQAIQDAVEDYCVGQAVNLTASLAQPVVPNVFSRPECTFKYCPHPELCKDPDQCVIADARAVRRM